MQNCENSGDLKGKRQSSTVDLGSNGCRRARAPWTARITRRGTRSQPSARDLRAQDACERDAAATSPESGGARRGLTGVAPGRHSRPSTRPQASPKRRGGASARDRGVKGGDRASSAAGAGRGWRGCSGELVEAPKCTRERDIEQGFLLTVCRRRRRAQNEGKAPGEETWRRRRIGRRSGGRGPKLQALRDPGDGFPWTTSVM
jgi:hypothetical protein